LASPFSVLARGERDPVHGSFTLRESPLVARRRTDGLAFVQHQPDRAAHELLREPPSCPSSCLAWSHSGHRIRLRKMSTFWSRPA